MDRYLSKETLPGKAASVGLAAPGDAGSWQRENKVLFSFALKLNGKHIAFQLNKLI